MKYQNQSLRNLLLAAMFLAIGLVLPFFTGRDQGDRQHAAAHAPAGVPLRLDLWLAVWHRCWFYYAAFALWRFFHAPHAYCFGHGIRDGNLCLCSGSLYSRARWQCTHAVSFLIVAAIAGRGGRGGCYDCTAGAFRRCIYLADVYFRRIPQCHSRYYSATGAYPGYHGGADRAKLVPFRRSEENPHTHREETI